jgi:hypothetical protein
MSWYNVSPTAMGWTPSKSLVMLKKWIVPRKHVILGGMWPCAIWKQNWNNWMNPLAEPSGENNPKGVQKPSQKDHLPINVACVGMPTWRNWKKI